jgi:hypothetical protein
VTTTNTATAGSKTLVIRLSPQYFSLASDISAAQIRKICDEASLAVHASLAGLSAKIPKASMPAITIYSDTATTIPKT